MLSILRIRNLALVADLTLELRPGFIAVTGETGAGKSILIGALNLLLGQRADRTLIRAGAELCTVEAALDLGSLRTALGPLLEKDGLEPGEDGQLLLKRTFSAGGANRQFVNGSPASLQALASLGEWLVDIHGPHDHQSLFRPARQLELLDAHARLQAERAAFAALFQSRKRLESEKAALVVDERTHLAEMELLRHQVQEIAAASLGPDDEGPLESEHARARNATRLLDLSGRALELLREGDESVTARAGQIGRALQELARIDPESAAIEALHANVTEVLRELQHALVNYAERIDIDAGRFQQLEERMNLLHDLRRKYGASISDIHAFGERARAKLSALEGRDAARGRIEGEVARLDAELRRSADTLGEARRRAIPKFVKAVCAQLRELGFQQSEFSVSIEAQDAPTSTGLDAVEFQFAPNPGEPSRPLRAIASSGELARVMLALKTVLADQDDIPVVIFDEVDANIGGEIAHAVGRKMRQIGRRRQVLCITHLAQVAAACDTHYVVSKTTRGGRTISEITEATGADRVAELARMLGGGAAARRHAEELLKSKRDG
jgi:DNA repair protein RecN (Recombination protein N)